MCPEDESALGVEMSVRRDVDCFDIHIGPKSFPTPRIFQSILNFIKY